MGSAGRGIDPLVDQSASKDQYAPEMQGLLLRTGEERRGEKIERNREGTREIEKDREKHRKSKRESAARRRGVKEGSAVGKGSSDSPLGPARRYESSAGVADSTKSITWTLVGTASLLRLFLRSVMHRDFARSILLSFFPRFSSLFLAFSRTALRLYTIYGRIRRRKTIRDVTRAYFAACNL